jgi:hypothetical protein
VEIRVGRGRSLVKLNRLRFTPSNEDTVDSPVPRNSFLLLSSDAHNGNLKRQKYLRGRNLTDDKRRLHATNRPPREELRVPARLGNHEYNTRHKDWDRINYAYRVRSVRQLKESIRLKEMKEVYGMKSAPRSLVYG